MLGSVVDRFDDWEVNINYEHEERKKKYTYVKMSK